MVKSQWLLNVYLCMRLLFLYSYSIITVWRTCFKRGKWKLLLLFIFWQKKPNLKKKSFLVYKRQYIQDDTLSLINCIRNKKKKKDCVSSSQKGIQCSLFSSLNFFVYGCLCVLLLNEYMYINNKKKTIVDRKKTWK